MESSIYNTKEGIESRLGSLADLNELVKERHDAGYQRHERLQEFYILGRFSSDTVGNFNKWGPDIFPAEVYANAPKVMTAEEYSEFYNANQHLISADADTFQSGGNMLYPQLP